MASSIGKLIESPAVSIIERAANRLHEQGKGEVYVQPILTQMGVDINDETPNLIFIPNDETNRNRDRKRVFVVEFKQTDTQILPDILIANADLHKHWLEEANDNYKIEYGLASNGAVLMGNRRESSIKAIASITSGDELAKRIDEWVKSQGSEE